MSLSDLKSAAGLLVVQRRKAVRDGKTHLLRAIDAASWAVQVCADAIAEADRERRPVPETVPGDFRPTGLYARDFPQTERAA